MTEPITYTENHGLSVAHVIGLMEDSLRDQDPNTIIQACLTVVVCMYKPNIDVKEIVRVVRGASEYISTALMDTTGEIKN